MMRSLAPVYFLLVDDLEENLLSLEALLRKSEGLVLLKARSGVEALELMLKHDVGLALLDVQMPGMDGFELAELMRGNERTGSIPIIFLTAGGADNQRRFRGYEAGAVDFIAKPIEPDILKSKAEVFYQLKRQQNMLARHSQVLEEKIRENARLLEESTQYAQALKEADQRKDEFIATLAHELRNPLAPIRNGIQILKMAPNTEEAPHLHDMMDRQMSQLVRLIDDLLDVSRISRGKIELRREKITLQSAIRDALETSRSLIDASRHTLDLNIVDQDLWVYADLTRISQIISNLLNNAAKYTPPGGKIILSAYSTDHQVVLSVADNGIGISKDMLPRVFDMFTQVDHKSNLAQGGLGIGLSLVKNLVLMHEGNIEVTSGGVDNGSIFTVFLPLAEAPAVIPAHAKEPANDATAGLNILVVDDNVPSAQTIGWMLELIGHTPTLAHSGQDAIEKANQSRPDAILLDIGLPDISGYDVCSQIRKDKRFDKTLMIAQTGWGQEKDRAMARDAGFDHHLVKPIKLDDLSQLLKTGTK